jgi:GNAT superfamily N-acetyltransferase
MTTPFTIDGAEVVRLGERDLPRLARFCEQCTAFFELVEGRPGGEATAAEMLAPLEPPYAAGTQHLFGIERKGELIGVADLLQGFPAAGEWYIGLLLLHPDRRSEGLGARACAAALAWIRAEGGVAVRLIVQQQNPRARAFWERQGFAFEREAIVQAGQLSSPVAVLLRRSD